MSRLAKFLIVILLMAFALSSYNVSGQVLAVEVVGEGKPVIMVPGLTCSGDVWKETVETLKDKYECHVITLPGFAGQPPIDHHEDQFLEKMKEHLITYIKDKKIEKPMIIGHSLGGFLALQIAIAEPELPSKLVIVDALPFLTAIQMPAATVESAKPFAENMKTQMLSSSGTSETQRLAMHRMILKSLINDEEKIEIAAKWGVNSDTETVAQAMYELYTTDVREDLTKIKAPTLVLGAWIAYKDYGVTREITLNNYKNQYAKLENVTIDLTDSGKHFIMWDDPEFFNKWLIKFL